MSPHSTGENSGFDFVAIRMVCLPAPARSQTLKRLRTTRHLVLARSTLWDRVDRVRPP